MQEAENEEDAEALEEGYDSRLTLERRLPNED